MRKKPNHGARIALLLLAALAVAPEGAAQTSPPAGGKASRNRVNPDEVVATIDGQKITAGMIERLRTGAPPQFQAATKLNNRDFLKQVAGLFALARKAEEEKLPDREPYKGQLEFLRMNFLANAYIATLNSKVTPTSAEVQKYYDDNKADYEEAVVRAIYIAFSQSGGTDAQGKKRLTESEAKGKAEQLAPVLRKGADFAAAAKANSDDQQSAEKGGEISPLKRNATGVPQEIRDAIFALKPGEVSDPVRQPAGFYIFRLERVQATPFDQVRSSIFTTVQGAKVKAELQRLMTDINITHENEAFFADPPAPAR